MTSFTPRKRYPYPAYSDTVDGGPADFSNFAAVKDLADEGKGDCMSAGVQDESEWASFVNGNIGLNNAETCELAVFSVSGGVAWVPDPYVAGALLRCQTTAKEWRLKPASLPGSGNYMAIAWEVSGAGTWNGGYTSHGHSGAESATAAGAFANRPETPEAGNIRLGTVIVHNKGTAPKYELINTSTLGVLPALYTFPNIQIAAPLGPRTGRQYIVLPGGLGEEILLSATRPSWCMVTVTGEADPNDQVMVSVKVGGKTVFSDLKVSEPTASDPTFKRAMCSSFLVPANQKFLVTVLSGSLEMKYAYLVL